MTVLGAAVLFRSFSGSAWAHLTATGYMLYGLVGALWIMVFVCPFCRFWDTDSCPCGYGRVAAQIRDRQPEDRFIEKFKKHSGRRTGRVMIFGLPQRRASKKSEKFLLSIE
jgi:hypothetical protein